MTDVTIDRRGPQSPGVPPAAASPRPPVTRLTPSAISFVLPRDRWAASPPEHRGIPRDQVRLLVARPGGTDHVRFADVDRFLDPGDVLVVNTSATRPSAIDGLHPDGPVTVHLSSYLGDGPWVVELRLDGGRQPMLHAAPGDLIALDGGAALRLHQPVADRGGRPGVRLWQTTATVLGGRLGDHVRRHGRPISYDGGRFLLSDHQTVFARHPGSAEMASAGRPFSDRLVTRLVSAGIQFAPVTLHAGVSSQEAGEPPQPERVEVPATTADIVNRARQRGSRVVVVGTTATRAIESAVDRGRVVARTGWTDLVITPDRGTQVVDGLITGWHDADASHLLLLQAVAGPDLVRRAYEDALSGPYLWHEFGDSALFLP